MPTYIQGYELDAVLSEDRTVECEITDHPVEKGVSITDHARVKPRTLTLDVIVSDTPAGALAQRRGIALDDGSPISTITSGPYGDFIASDVARAYLEDLMVKRQPVTVSTEWVRADGSKGYKAYDNMMIQSIGETITADSGDSCQCKVAFKQIIYVTNDRTTVDVAVPRAKKKLDKGNKPNEDVKKAPSEVTSAAFDIEHGVIPAAKSFVGGLLPGGG